MKKKIVEIPGKLKSGTVLISLVEVERKVKKTKGGIIIPDGAESPGDTVEYDEHPAQGFVVKVADDVTFAKPGDTVALGIGITSMLIKEEYRASLEKFTFNKVNYLLICLGDMILNYDA